MGALFNAAPRPEGRCGASGSYPFSANERLRPLTLITLLKMHAPVERVATVGKDQKRPWEDYLSLLMPAYIKGLICPVHAPC